MGGFPGGIGDSTTSTTEVQNLFFPQTVLACLLLRFCPISQRAKKNFFLRPVGRASVTRLRPESVEGRIGSCGYGPRPIHRRSGFCPVSACRGTPHWASNPHFLQVPNPLKGHNADPVNIGSWTPRPDSARGSEPVLADACRRRVRRCAFVREPALEHIIVWASILEAPFLQRLLSS